MTPFWQIQILKEQLRKIDPILRFVSLSLQTIINFFQPTGWNSYILQSRKHQQVHEDPTYLHFVNKQKSIVFFKTGITFYRRIGQVEKQCIVNSEMECF